MPGYIPIYTYIDICIRHIKQYIYTHLYDASEKTTEGIVAHAGGGEVQRRLGSLTNRGGWGLRAAVAAGTCSIGAIIVDVFFVHRHITTICSYLYIYIYAYHYNYTHNEANRVYHSIAGYDMLGYPIFYYIAVSCTISVVMYRLHLYMYI